MLFSIQLCFIHFLISVGFLSSLLISSSQFCLIHLFSKLMLDSPFLLSFFHTFMHRNEHLHYLIISLGSSGTFSRFSKIYVSHWGRAGQGGGVIYMASFICCHVLCKHRGVTLWLSFWILFLLIFNHKCVLFLSCILLFLSGICFQDDLLFLLIYWPLAYPSQG